ncbi:hypothetical protein BC832DRAFT_89050 [Gaertneriomyces semiglobifer]|nr:hypothetical protein BC832DRAFT_89050 [Gaertneriomyces semiglobifer]
MVRESNFSCPFQGHAAVTITPTHYDKRALTCTDPRSLFHTLTNLSYVTAVANPTFAQVITSDGGLECIMRVLKRARARRGEKLSRNIFSAGLTCLSHIIIRGNSTVRLRAKEAKVLELLLVMFTEVALSMDLSMLSHTRQAPYPARANQHAQPSTITHIPNARHDPAAAAAPTMGLAHRRTSTQDVPMLPTLRIPPMRHPTPATHSPMDTTEVSSSGLEMSALAWPSHLQLPDEPSPPSPWGPFAYESPMQSHPPFYRHDDVLAGLKMVAYMLKHPEVHGSVSADLHENLLTAIEKFTLPTNRPEVRRWAIVALRTAFKRPDPVALRKCGYLRCAKTEDSPREFLKCSRCRRVVYCSKPCQRNAWGLHRHWCLKLESVVKPASPYDGARSTTTENNT